MKTSVAIVEDNATMCEELAHIVRAAEDLQLAGTCRSAAVALQKLPVWRPDVIVMDIQLPDGSGITCTSRLSEQLPNTQILMFTILDDTDQIIRALEAGATGYLLKDAPPAQILAAIRDVRAHGTPMSREVARKLVASFRRPASQRTPAELSPREAEILRLLADGLLYKEISDRLDITIDTVATHVKRIYRKLHVRTRTEAVVKFLG